MAKSKKLTTNKTRKHHQDREETEKNDPRRTKALILGALTAGGVFQMNSWQVQAHANRSSHSAATVANTFVAPNDYILLRQQVTAPNSVLVRELIESRNAIDSFTKAAIPGVSLEDLQKRNAAIESRLRAQEPSGVAAMVRKGDTAGAIASIEGEGWPERVLGSYLWALLDTAYLTKSDAMAPTNLALFSAIADPAMKYSDNLLISLKGNRTPQDIAAKERIAEILHNIASFTVQGENPSEADLSRALAAAKRTLTIRQELKQPTEIMRAHWMLGETQLKAGDVKAAQQSLQTALEQATELKDQPGVAWANLSLARAARKAGNDAAAKRFEATARSIATNFKGKDTSIEFLRLELQRGI
jgi:hypothetical protein